MCFSSKVYRYKIKERFYFYFEYNTWEPINKETVALAQ